MRCFPKFVILFFFLFVPNICFASLPTEQLQTSIDQILTILRDPELKPESREADRREKLRQVAKLRFDYQKMSQLSLGKHWKGITDEQKKEFTQLFSKLLEDTYMAKIETYTDEKVVFLKERIKKKKAQVNTKVITKTVEIPINYRMYRKSESNWMVYDMVIEGVSMIGNYRSQFGQLLEQKSFEDLISKLKAKDN